MSYTSNSTGKTSGRGKLKCLTYLSPSLPIELFETITEYLEEQLGVVASLGYQSRHDGPKLDAGDPLLEDDIDLAFISSRSYINLLGKDVKNVALLPVAAIHQHPKSELKPGYYADVVVQSGLKEKVKDFMDLRGCKWAYNNPASLSGNVVTLRKLKELGENPSFFGNLLESGSHINSLKMIIKKQADAACIDANCVALYLDQNPHLKGEVFTLESWGPLPPYPIVINSKRVSSTMKSSITSALLRMGQYPVWNMRLKEFRILGFAANGIDIYKNQEEEIKKERGLSIGVVYY